MSQVQIMPVPGLPLIAPGDDLAALIADSLQKAALTLQAGDILVVTSKIVAKAEDCYLNLQSITPSPQAEEIATITGKDARLVQVVLQESQAISRVAFNVLVTRHRLGFVSANAGIDQSNVGRADAEGKSDWVLLLPKDPDQSARRIREGLAARFGHAPAIIISDTHGRPHRLGNIGVAVGVAGIPALLDLRGKPDLFSRRLQHTDIGLADELAAAADLVSGQAAEGLPVTLIRGVRLPDGAPSDGQASDLIRPPHMDLYK
jgi:coenzyme F420-0:L-glutamate ligase / coenzyme F420-1:gamma-L-glutamate ligase